LVERTKSSWRHSITASSLEEAKALELEAQQWSMEQPGFNERILAIKTALAERRAAK
jgi:hypothetical protein